MASGNSTTTGSIKDALTEAVAGVKAMLNLDVEESLELSTKYIESLENPAALVRIMKAFSNNDGEQMYRIGKEAMKSQRPKLPAILEKSVFTVPFFLRNPVMVAVGLQTGFVLPDADKLINMWKKLRIATIERMLVVLHLNLNKDEADYNWWMSTDQIWLLRRVFVGNDVNDSMGEKRLREAFDALIAIESGNGREQAERKWFREIGMMASIRSAIGENTSHSTQDPYLGAMGRRESAHLRLAARNCCISVYSFLLLLFDRWFHSMDGPRALQKIGVTIPRYAETDRGKIVKVLENKCDVGKPLNYLELLYNFVGESRFEYIVFGRLKSCATCGTTNRQKWLRGCQKCEKDLLYPKRRYCNVECQRIDWPKHREEHKKHDETREKESKAK